MEVVVVVSVDVVVEGSVCVWWCSWLCLSRCPWFFFSMCYSFYVFFQFALRFEPKLFLCLDAYLLVPNRSRTVLDSF